MSENRFVVEVVGKLDEARAVTVSRVQDALNLDEAKATSLVTRMPGVITRPSSEDRAMKVALRLQAAGVAALHRPLDASEEPIDAERSASAPPDVDRSPPRVPDAPALDPEDPASAPSVDATHPGIDRDPRLTPMSEAGFGAADIVLPTDVPEDVRSTQERDASPRPRATFVEAGATSQPGGGRDADLDTPVLGRPAGAHDGGDVRADTPVPDRRDVDARHADPVYRQTRSSAEPPITLSPPPDDALRRSGVAESEIAAGERLRGRFGRRIAAQVALPVILSWALGAAAIWFLLPLEGRLDLFVPLAAATAVAALLGALLAALTTAGMARDVVKLRDEARRVAMGELTAPVTTRRDDELGEIAGSLERMRLSLQEGMERLRKRRR